MVSVSAHTLSCLLFWLPQPLSLITLEEVEQWDFVASPKTVDGELFYTTWWGEKRKENRPQAEYNNGNFHFKSPGLQQHKLFFKPTGGTANDLLLKRLLPTTINRSVRRKQMLCVGFLFKWWHKIKKVTHRTIWIRLSTCFFFVCFVCLGVTGLVTTDEKNARNIDVNLWAMTNQETGEYGVSCPLVWFLFNVLVI